MLTCWEALDRADPVVPDRLRTVDPGDDAALASFHDEGVRVLDGLDRVRRVMATAARPS